jgi:hypothetical protein
MSTDNKPNLYSPANRWPLVDRAMPEQAPLEVPEVDSCWKHTNGGIYWVLHIANEQTTRPIQYPVTVVYQNRWGVVWARPLAEWARSMSRYNYRPSADDIPPTNTGD